MKQVPCIPFRIGIEEFPCFSAPVCCPMVCGLAVSAHAREVVGHIRALPVPKGFFSGLLILLLPLSLVEEWIAKGWQISLQERSRRSPGSRRTETGPVAPIYQPGEWKKREG